MHRTAQGTTVLGVAPAGPTHWHRLARAVQAAGISEAQRAVLPPRAHDEARLAFALAQIADHPMTNGRIDTPAGRCQAGADQRSLRQVRRGLRRGGARRRDAALLDLHEGPIHQRPVLGRASRGRVDFPDDSTGIRAAQREQVSRWAKDLAGRIWRYPYRQPFWTVHIGVVAAPVTDAAGELARGHRAEAVQDELLRMLADALGPDLAVTVRYQLHNDLGEAPPAASRDYTGAPTGSRVVLWLDHVADLPDAAPAAAEPVPPTPAGAPSAVPGVWRGGDGNADLGPGR